MHDIKWIREHEEEFDRGLARRGLPPESRKLIALDERRRAAIQKAEAALARRNAASKEIGAAKKSNEESAAQALMAEVARLKTEIPALEAEEKQLSTQLDEALAQMAYRQVRRLPVIEDDRVVGILAQADVAQEVKDKKAGQVLEAISQPASDGNGGTA